MDARYTALMETNEMLRGRVATLKGLANGLEIENQRLADTVAKINADVQAQTHGVEGIDARPVVTWEERVERAGSAMYGTDNLKRIYRESTDAALRAAFPELAPKP